MKSESFLWLITMLFISRPFVTLFHELGHAIPLLFITKENVTIHIGSYGEAKNSLKLKLGKLEINFKYNLFKYHGGLCTTKHTDFTKTQTILYIACGPFASLIVALFSCFMAYTFDLPDFLSILFFVFLLYSFFDLIINIIPSKTPIRLDNGTFTFNDGEMIARCLKSNRYSEKYANAINYYNEKKYNDSLKLFNELLNDGFIDDMILRLKISCHLQLKEYEVALKTLETLKFKFTFNSDDYSNFAFIQSQFNNHLLALESYDKSLEINPKNLYSLNNKGYTLNVLERFEEAVIYFDKAIEENPKMAYAFNNRGLSKIKLGQIEEGLSDLNYSHDLDPENSYYYRNIGIYHQDRGELQLALDFYHKSKSLDSETHNIDALIKEIQSLLAT